MNHTPFIVASYAAAAIILGGLILVTVLDYRRQKARLAARAVEDGEDRA